MGFIYSITYLIRDLFDCKFNMQEWLNHRYKDTNKERFLIDKKYVDYVVVKGDKYHPTTDLFTVTQVRESYRLDDIKPTDIFLDIGANIGGATVFASKKAAKVYAFEPIVFKELYENVALNKLTNVYLSDSALGDTTTVVNWMTQRRKMKCDSLTEIIKACGGHVDFMKLDCDGGEWAIKPHELKGIRRIEAEVHSYHIGTMKPPKLIDFLKMLEEARFKYEIDITSDKTMLVHAASMGDK